MTRWIVLAVTGGFLAVCVSNPAAAKAIKTINEQLLLILATPAPKDGEAEKTAMESLFYRINRTTAPLNSTAKLGWQRQKFAWKETGVLG